MPFDNLLLVRHGQPRILQHSHPLALRVGTAVAGITEPLKLFHVASCFLVLR